MVTIAVVPSSLKVNGAPASPPLSRKKLCLAGAPVAGAPARSWCLAGAPRRGDSTKPAAPLRWSRRQAHARAAVSMAMGVGAASSRTHVASGSAFNERGYLITHQRFLWIR